MLMGINGELWELQSDFSILRTKNGYASVGSGCEVAKGVLMMNYTVVSKMRKKPRKQLI